MPFYFFLPFFHRCPVCLPAQFSIAIALNMAYQPLKQQREDRMAETKLIQWSDDYSVGVSILDEQHKSIIRMVNKIHAYITSGASSEEISEILNQMTQYAMNHFRTEEDYMKLFEYPEFELHRKEHMEYWKKTALFANEAMSGNKEVLGDILSFLIDWWMDHILRTDLRYKEFFQEKGLG